MPVALRMSLLTRNTEITWILTRQLKPEASVVRAAMDILSRNGLSRTSMVKTNHRTRCR